MNDVSKYYYPRKNASIRQRVILAAREIMNEYNRPFSAAEVIARLRRCGHRNIPTAQRASYYLHEVFSACPEGFTVDDKAYCRRCCRPTSAHNAIWDLCPDCIEVIVKMEAAERDKR